MGDEFLVHHGIKGQRWGIRRFQNEDGTRTAAGKARERNGEQGSAPTASSQKKGLTDAQKATLKKVAIGAGVAVAAGLAVYGAVKYSDAVKEANFQAAMEAGKRRKQETAERIMKENVAIYEKWMAEGNLKSYQFATSNNAARRADEASDATDKLAKEGSNAVKSISVQGRTNDGGVYAVGRSDKRTMDILSNIDKYGSSAEKMYGVTAKEIREAKNADEIRKLLDKKSIK